MPVKWSNGFFYFESLKPSAVSVTDPVSSPQGSLVATLEEVLRALGNLHMQDADDGLPKRHQPLTLLWAIGKARQGEDRLTPWPVARTQIEHLISMFGRPTDRPNAYLPFLALARTDLWELTAKPPPAGPGRGPDARRAWLADATPPVKGGLSRPVYNLMTTNTEAAMAVVARLLGAHFEDIDADTLLEAAGLSDLASGINDLDEQEAARTLLSALASDSTVIAAEASNVESTEYERKSGRVIVRRGEAQLVATYKKTLPPGQKAVRLQLSVGLTDLYDEETADIIEAKVSAEHRYVRQALGQLLDYAAHCTKAVKQLTALFPARPSPADIKLLHRYGIDCMHWEGGTTFRRLAAPPQARERIRATWSQHN